MTPRDISRPCSRPYSTSLSRYTPSCKIQMYPPNTHIYKRDDASVHALLVIVMVVSSLLKPLRSEKSTIVAWEWLSIQNEEIETTLNPTINRHHRLHSIRLHYNSLGIQFFVEKLVLKIVIQGVVYFFLSLIPYPKRTVKGKLWCSGRVNPTHGPCSP
jgi:hypothetical protein